MAVELPNRAYYRGCQGSWRSEFRLRVVDRGAFWRARMAWYERLQVLSLVLWPRVLGRFWMETTVDFDSGASRGEVVHTTLIRWWGMAVFRSREVIQLDGDGRRFVLTGVRRGMPLLWREEPFEAPGEVDAEGSRASYAFAWFGARLDQTTVAEPNRVTITQRTPWLEGVQALERQSG